MSENQNNNSNNKMVILSFVGVIVACAISMVIFMYAMAN